MRAVEPVKVLRAGVVVPVQVRVTDPAQALRARAGEPVKVLRAEPVQALRVWAVERVQVLWAGVVELAQVGRLVLARTCLGVLRRRVGCRRVRGVRGLGVMSQLPPRLRLRSPARYSLLRCSLVLRSLLRVGTPRTVRAA